MEALTNEEFFAILKGVYSAGRNGVPFSEWVKENIGEKNFEKLKETLEKSNITGLITR